MTDAIDRRTVLADAAISVLARTGQRGLTHRAVDQAAGLPEGSCSNHFRTREALLTAAVDRLTESDLAELPTGTADLDNPEQVVELLCTLLMHWLTVDRDHMLARYELALESTRRPELRKTLSEAGSRFRALAASILGRLGAPNPEQRALAFVGCLDGLIFDQLAGAGARTPDVQELRETLTILLNGFTSR
ncbi:TetR/AcrR family transcriptional regulator [Nocardia huaxiensis]|uniref:TetR/AcrR family transcriptional regulator n=1 Tax=Nocardia huaxiensis TaxID=2755382 RepID=UPI001E2DAF35|nr:TetR/AcrR family transcriptional regulator [Nocardia huaxiensis]UFS96333.1 TetR family transcriptional regulator [Nocardia huaxiensis]